MTTVLFAVADTNGDNTLSFEEITTLHKTIFDKIDSNTESYIRRGVGVHAGVVAGNGFSGSACVRPSV